MLTAGQTAAVPRVGERQLSQAERVSCRAGAVSAHHVRCWSAA